ncbi:MAG: ATP-grasp domain-containing protein [Woeseiaceae bacterium]
MRIGIIGAGQLGQMLGFAARELGDECRFVDPGESPPAAACGDVIRRPFDDDQALADLAATSDVVTYEFENVPVEALLRIEEQVPIYPPPDALRHSQDRLDEKRLFEELGIPLPGYRAVDSRDDLADAAEALGLPLVVKTRRLGYDGKGQFVVRESDQVDAAWQALGNTPLITEQWVPFDYEVSCIGARNVAGDVAMYPLSRNVHEGGILRTSSSPVDAPQLAGKAEEYVRRLPASRGHAGMINLIGTVPPAARTLAAGTLHDYGKAPRPGRKLGHITVTAGSPDERDRLMASISRNLTQSAPQSGTAS